MYLFTNPVKIIINMDNYALYMQLAVFKPTYLFKYVFHFSQLTLLRTTHKAMTATALAKSLNFSLGKPLHRYSVLCTISW